MHVLIELSVIVAMVCVLIVVLVLFQRSLDKPGGRDGLGGGVGNALGGGLGILDPGAARAMDDLKSQQNVGPTTPTPDDSDDPIRLLKGPDGSPRAIRIKRPTPPDAG